MLSRPRALTRVDPFAKPEPEQRSRPGSITRIRTMEKLKPGSVRGLIARGEGVRENRQARASAVVEALDGAAVIPAAYSTPAAAITAFEE